MLKRRSSPYQRGRRSDDWMKVKGIWPADAFISGWRAGEGYNSGKVGSLELSVYETPPVPGRDAGEAGGVQMGGRLRPRVIACINIPPALRAPCSTQHGALRPEFYNQVAEFTGHGIGAGGMVRGPIFVRLRPDKNAADCLASQLEGWPDV
jgi:bifunctional non-homologous end joining protein LigD